MSSYAYGLDEGAREAEFAAREQEKLAKDLGRVKLELVAHLHENDEERTGDPETVLKSIDLPQQVKSLTFTLSRPVGEYGSERAVFILFDRDGVEAVVRANNEDWPNAVRARLRSTFAPQRPWYAFVRRTGVQWLTYLAINAIAIGSTVVALMTGTHVPLAWTLVVLAFQLGASPVIVFWSRIFPMFELRSAETSPVGRRVIGFAGSAIAYVAAIFIPLLLPK